MSPNALPRILIAEDEPFIQKLYRLHLENAGFAVETAGDGEETLAHIAKHPPDLLLLDLLMPKLDGFAVLKHLQELHVHFPIIVLSNLGQESDETQCRALGAVAYLVKSDIDLADLPRTIRQYLTGHGTSGAAPAQRGA